MSKSFQEERNRYKPSLPEVLQDLTRAKIHLAQPTTSFSPSMEIGALFPHLYGKQICHFLIGPKKKTMNPLRIGVFFSGGQAPGGHNVLLGLFEGCKNLHPESRLFGFLGGPSGFMENRILEITEELLLPYRNMGGFDLLGSGRTKIEKPEQFAQSLATVKEHHLDGLIVIGGDDSNTNAALLAEYFLQKGVKAAVVGIPKTIDGDLKNHFIETSFGFDTASKLYAGLISNIARDALSAKKYSHFIKLMGRTSSHIALECALRTHPNLTLIGEEIAYKKKSLKEIVADIADLVVERSALGKNYGIYLIPEGLIEFIEEFRLLIEELGKEKVSEKSAQLLALLPPEIMQKMLEKDPHGNLLLSQIETEKLLVELVQRELKARQFRGKFSPLCHFLGYEGRCAPPTNFDAQYTYALGRTAILLVENGYTGYMTRVSHLAKPASEWEVGGIPLTLMIGMEKRKGVSIPVICKTLVDLQGEPFRNFSYLRDLWRTGDLYQVHGPIQYFGPPSLTEETTLTLRGESHVSLSL